MIMQILFRAAPSRIAKLSLAALAVSAALAAGCAGDPPGELLIGGSSGQTGSGGSGTGTSTGMSTGQGSTQPQEATFEVSLDNETPGADLRDSVDLTVLIAPNGYVGPVALAVEGLPADVSAELGSAMAVLDGETTEAVDLTLTTISSTQAGDLGFTVTGTVETGVKSAAGTLSVRPVITILIPQGLAGMQGQPGSPNTTAFGDYPTTIKALPGMSAQNPVTVNFFNADNVPHQIHAEYDAQGFPHGTQDIVPGQLDPLVRQVSSPGTYDYYPHDIGPSILGRIVIE
jgi:plastocyanin